jgi:hypothetical protein
MNLERKNEAKERTAARITIRTTLSDAWIPADEWMKRLDTARDLDALAGNRSWNGLRRDPFAQIFPEPSDEFYEALCDLYAYLSSRGIDPLPAISVLASVTRKHAQRWMLTAEQRGLIQLHHTSVDHLRRSTRRKESHV